jgi:hypothetical protein
MRSQGRTYGEQLRDHVATAFYRYLGGTQVATDAAPPVLALDQPFGGLAALWLMPNEGSVDELAEWCRAELDAGLAGNDDVLQVLDFAEEPYPDVVAKLAAEVGVTDVMKRLVRLYFLRADPGSTFTRVFPAVVDRVAARPDVTVGLAAPFLLTTPGAPCREDLW